MLFGDTAHASLIYARTAIGGLHFAPHQSFHFVGVDGAGITLGQLSDEDAIDYGTGGHEAELLWVSIPGLLRFQELIELVSHDLVGDVLAVNGNGHGG